MSYSAPQDDVVQRYQQRLATLRQERSSWITHYQELNDYIFPRRFRYLNTDRNKGTKRNDKIINNKATIALRTLVAGMMSGITSPARPWHKLLPPEQFRDDPEVRDWLDSVENVLREEFLRSNIYNSLHELYGILAAMGTPALYVEESQEPGESFRSYVFPVGQYCLATSARQRVDTIYREFSMTVVQLVDEFGLEVCSPNVQMMFKEGKYDEWIDVCHVVEPNRNRENGKVDNKNKPWKSCYFEVSHETGRKPLRESGFDEFPVMAPRWSVTGEDVYGSCPGMDALGDCKALQLLERRKAQVVDKIVNPPMKAPASMKSSRISLLPGDTNFVPDNVAAGPGFSPAIEVRPDAVTVIERSIREHESRIWSTFYADLFLMMLSGESVQPLTAREVSERHEEKMLQLGPVLERIHDELLDPLINRVVQILYRQGKLPQLPQQLVGSKLRVEYVSIMAQAQKLLGTTSFERFTSYVGSVSAVKPEVLDAVNFDKMVDEYRELLGIPADLLNKAEIVQQIRQQRVQQQQAAQQQQAIMTTAEGAKVASETDLSGDSALSRLLNTAGGGGGALGRA